MYDITNFYVEYGGNNGKYFHRKMYYQLGEEGYDEKYKRFISECRNTDVYRSIYAYETDDIEHCRILAPFYIDLDGDLGSDFELLRQDVKMCMNYLKSLGLAEDDIEIYFSGAKGFHIIVQADVLAITPAENLNLLYKAWANYFYNTLSVKSVDLKIYDRKRLFRIPGSINSKTGLYKTYIRYSFLENCTIRDLFMLAESPLSRLNMPSKRPLNKKAAENFFMKSKNFYKKKIKPKKVTLPKEKKELFPCVKNLLQTGVSKGSRNNTLAFLASAIMQSGYTLEETTDIMQDWNTNNNPPMSYAEVDNTVKSAYSMLVDGRSYGCKSFKEYGYCIEGCSLLEDRNKP